jgi:DNA-binding MarR family transcriptional regulator
LTYVKYCIIGYAREMASARSRTKAELARDVWRFLFDFIVETAPRRNRVLGEHGLSPNDSRALFALDERRGRTMSSLAQEWGTDASYVTAVVDRLERKGLAARSALPGDRRVKLVLLTTAGSRLKKRLGRELHEPPDELLAMTTSDLEALWASTSKLRAKRD